MNSFNLPVPARTVHPADLVKGTYVMLHRSGQQKNARVSVMSLLDASPRPPHARSGVWNARPAAGTQEVPWKSVLALKLISTEIARDRREHMVNGDARRFLYPPTGEWIGVSLDAPRDPDAITRKRVVPGVKDNLTAKTPVASGYVLVHQHNGDGKVWIRRELDGVVFEAMLVLDSEWDAFEAGLTQPLRDAAATVLDVWEHGDLPGAVNALAEVMDIPLARNRTGDELADLVAAVSGALDGNGDLIKAAAALVEYLT